MPVEGDGSGQSAHYHNETFIYSSQLYTASHFVPRNCFCLSLVRTFSSKRSGCSW